MFGTSPRTLAHLVLPVKTKGCFFHWQHVHNASHPPEGRVIYRGPGLFSEDAQRKCLSIPLCNPHLEQVGEGMCEMQDYG